MASLVQAWWQSGYAEDCKSFYAGSIPTQASKNKYPRMWVFFLGPELNRHGSHTSKVLQPTYVLVGCETLRVVNQVAFSNGRQRRCEHSDPGLQK